MLCSSWQAGAGQTIVGISAIDGSLDWRRRNSQPFIRGIERSSRIKHGRRTSVRRSSGSSPSPAVTIARPSFLSSSTYESRAVSSSSTIKTVSINSAHMRETRARAKLFRIALTGSKAAATLERGVITLVQWIVSDSSCDISSRAAPCCMRHLSIASRLNRQSLPTLKPGN